MYKYTFKLRSYAEWDKRRFVTAEEAIREARAAAVPAQTMTAYLGVDDDGIVSPLGEFPLQVDDRFKGFNYELQECDDKRYIRCPNRNCRHTFVEQLTRDGYCTETRNWLSNFCPDCGTKVKVG